MQVTGIRSVLLRSLAALALFMGLASRPATAQAHAQAQAMACGNACEAYWSYWMDEWHWQCGMSGDPFQYCSRSDVFDCNDSGRCYLAEIQNSDGGEIQLAKFCEGHRTEIVLDPLQAYLLDGDVPVADLPPDPVASHAGQ